MLRICTCTVTCVMWLGISELLMGLTKETVTSPCCPCCTKADANSQTNLASRIRIIADCAAGIKFERISTTLKVLTSQMEAANKS